jgi:hypothetical protein
MPLWKIAVAMVPALAFMFVAGLIVGLAVKC